jgi:hypothetical protein
MTDKKKTELEKEKAPEIAEGDPSKVSRRDLLAKGYSAAVLGLVFGGAAARLVGCKDDKKSHDDSSGTDDCDTESLCDDSCQFANDGACDDGADGSSYSACELGTDCTDCGTRYTDCSDSYSDGYSDGYSNYSNSYSNGYYNYPNYADGYYDYYNVYSNYGNFDNSW